MGRNRGTFATNPTAMKDLAYDLLDYARLFGGVVDVFAIERVVGCSRAAASQRLYRLRQFLARARIGHGYSSGMDNHVTDPDTGEVTPGHSVLRMEPEAMARFARSILRDFDEDRCFHCGAKVRTPGVNATMRENSVLGRGDRERMPKRRRSWNYKLQVPGFEFYVTIGCFADGRIGELFIDAAKQGSALRTSLHAWATQISKSLQFGMPVIEVVHTYRNVASPPAGTLAWDESLPEALRGFVAASPWDAVARLLEVEADEEGRHRNAVKEVEEGT